MRYNSFVSAKETISVKKVQIIKKGMVPQMKSIVKKLAAGVTACLCLASSLTGCYSEDKAWSAKRGEDTAAIGVYIYYLSSAYSEALGKVEDASKSVFDQQIEEKDGAQWVKDRAKESIQLMYYVDQRFEELGLTLSDDDQNQISSLTSNVWAYSSSQLNEYGIAKTSLERAYSEFIIKYQKVFEALYDKGGEKEVPEDDIRTFYESTYTDFEYFTCSYTKTDEDGSSEEMSDDEKAEAKTEFEAYVTKVQEGELTMEEAAEEYQDSIESDTSTFSSQTLDADSISAYYAEEFAEKLESMKEGDVAYVDLPDSGKFYVLYKKPISEKCDEVLQDSDQRLNIIATMKSDEYSEEMEAAAKELDDITFNDSAINSYDPKMFYSDSDLVSSESSSSESE